MAKKDIYKFTIQFSGGDPQHQQVAEILNQQGRRKAQFLVNTVLHYIHCSETPDMSIRTIQDLEHGISNPKAETILLIARELDISIDAILFPNIVRGHISKTAMDFFAGKSEAEVQKYVSLCQQADKLKTDK